MQSAQNEEKAWSYLEERFGVSQDAGILEGLALKKVAGDVWLTTEEHELDMNVKTFGIRAVRFQDIGLKPTTYLLQFLGEAIEENVVELERSEFLELLDGKHVECELDSPGYVAIKWDGRMWGCGLYKNGVVSTRIPKGRGKQLREALEHAT